MSAGLGNDTLDGGAGQDALNGGEGSDSILGGLGNDMLNGGVGFDTMKGGAGDDVYYVDSSLDVITEVTGEGLDTVNSSITYTLGAYQDKLTLTGVTAINAYGNADVNTLTGNSAANYLDGKAGADVMIGGLGGDIYVVDNSMIRDRTNR